MLPTLFYSLALIITVSKADGITLAPISGLTTCQEHDFTWSDASPPYQVDFNQHIPEGTATSNDTITPTSFSFNDVLVHNLTLKVPFSPGTTWNVNVGDSGKSPNKAFASQNFTMRNTGNISCLPILHQHENIPWDPSGTNSEIDPPDHPIPACSSLSLVIHDVAERYLLRIQARARDEQLGLTLRYYPVVTNNVTFTPPVPAGSAVNLLYARDNPIEIVGALHVYSVTESNDDICLILPDLTLHSKLPTSSPSPSPIPSAGIRQMPLSLSFILAIIVIWGCVA